MKIDAIATWKMAKDAFEQIKYDYQNEPVLSLLKAIEFIDDKEDIHTVGSFSRPNKKGFLQLDGAYMNSNMDVGAVIEARHINHPASLAYELSKLRNNCILAGDGADEYGKEKNLYYVDTIPTYSDKATDNHDTFGVILNDGNMLHTAISSSGRANKHEGRVGDSPLIGSGFYCDEDGACVATGDGEAILRGCLCKEVVTRMAMGMDVKEALYSTCDKHKKKLPYEADFCLLAMDKDGNYSAYTSQSIFPFAILKDGQAYLKVAYPDGSIKDPDECYFANYHGD